jgi:nitrogen regulatory protein P-II 1
MTKKIEAIIREDKLNDVKESLHSIGIVGMNVTEVRGHGRQGGITLSGRNGTYQVDLLPRVQVNIVSVTITSKRRSRPFVTQPK